MSNSYSKTTTQSWGSRLMESIKGVIAGFVCVAIAIGLLWWNEGRAVKTAKGLEEGAAAVVSVEDISTVNKDNQGKLVHMSGTSSTNEHMIDVEFEIDTVAFKLRRKVEMYQWKEEQESEERKKLGGGTETVTTYNYDEVWSDDIIDSDDFEMVGYDNPSKFPIESQKVVAKSNEFGAYTLSNSLVSQINEYEIYVPTFSEDFMSSNHLTLSGNMFYSGDDSSPEIGDVRIQFELVPANQEVSIISQQINNTFEPYITETETEIDFLSIGQVSAENMFKQAEANNKMLTWILRLVGLILMVSGIGLIFKPLSVVGDVIPFVGNLLEAGVGIFAFIIGLVISLFVIAIAWLFYRPLIGIVLILLCGGLIFAGVKFLGKKKTEEPTV